MTSPVTILVALPPSPEMSIVPEADNLTVEAKLDLQGLLAEGGDLRRMVYTEPPSGMTRMEAVRRSTPGVYLMDTGAAAVLRNTARILAITSRALNGLTT